MRAYLANSTVLAIAILFAATAFGSSSTIRSIVIKGNTVFTEREILGWISSRVGLAFSEEVRARDTRAIAEHFRRAGYIDVQVGQVDLQYAPDSTYVDVALTIQEGRQTVIGSIICRGQKELSEGEILGMFDTKPGRPLEESVFERDIDALLRRYEQIGYPFAHCRVEGLERRPGEDRELLEITLQIDEGQRVTISEIRVEGNKDTRPEVIVRETRLTVGELFNPGKVDAIRQRLRRLNIFSDVSEPELYIRNEKGGLLIRVQEGNTNTFDGVLGYIPATVSDEPGYLSGLASISMRNLFGTGRKLSFRWQRDDRFSQELGLRYLEPWIFGFPANVGGGFIQRKQDTSYVRRVFELKGELMLSEDLSISLLFGSESVIPSADTTVSRVFRSSTISFGGEILYDTRDDLYSPTTGARYRTDYQYGTKTFSNVPVAYASRVKGNVIVQRFTLDLEFYLSTFARQVVAVGLHGRELRSGQMEESEMFRFGGMHTLRGYRESQFLGSRMAWVNTEYRFLVARRSFMYGFVDGGYYLRPADELRGIPKVDAFKYGYGIGVQLQTGLGLLGVSFALGQGDAFTQGKVHFGLINEF